MTLGPALIATRGFASPELEAAFTRAHELCVALDRPCELRPWCCTAWPPWPSSAAATTAPRRLLTQILGLGVGELAVEAHELLACSTFHQGAAARAVGYAERGLALFDEGGATPRPHLPGPVSGSTRPSAATTGRPWPCGSSAARTAPWTTASRRRALAAAHPYSLASAEVQLAYLHQYRGEPSETLRLGRAGPGDRERARLPDPGRPGGHPRRLGPGRDR